MKSSDVQPSKIYPALYFHIIIHKVLDRLQH